MKLPMLIMQAKREYWEHRRLFVLAPLVVAALITGLQLWGIMSDPVFESNLGFISDNKKEFFIAEIDEKNAQINFEKPGVLAFIIAMQQFINWWFFALVAIVLALHYCQSALFQDRKSREISFWRSMPVSETANVVSKLWVATISIPLMLMLMSLVSMLLSITVLGLWLASGDQFLSALGNFLLIPTYVWGSLMLVLLLLPLLAWTLLISSLVSRNPQLFAWFIPFLMLVVDRLLHRFFGINLHLYDALKSYWDYVKKVFLVSVNSSESGIYFSFDFHLYPNIFMISLVAVLLYMTIWLRNNRYEI